MQWYWEAGHYKSALGNEMLETMLGGATRFGIAMTSRRRYCRKSGKAEAAFDKDRIDRDAASDGAMPSVRRLLRCTRNPGNGASSGVAVDLSAVLRMCE